MELLGLVAGLPPSHVPWQWLEGLLVCKYPTLGMFISHLVNNLLYFLSYPSFKNLRFWSLLDFLSPWLWYLQVCEGFHCLLDSHEPRTWIKVWWLGYDRKHDSLATQRKSMEFDDKAMNIDLKKYMLGMILLITLINPNIISIELDQLPSLNDE